MLTRVIKRNFSSNPESYARIRQYKGANINVASHNQERRHNVQGDFTFWGTWGMGIEGFSKMAPMSEMHPFWGHKAEWRYLLILALVAPLIIGARKKNEDGMASQIVATNTYARVHLDDKSRKISSSWK
jgi:hypothetical protein